MNCRVASHTHSWCPGIYRYSLQPRVRRSARCMALAKGADPTVCSVRCLRRDGFWFIFFHECGHIVPHGKKILFLEGKGMLGVEENEANRFAADRLIAPASWSEFQPARKHHLSSRGLSRSIRESSLVGCRMIVAFRRIDSTI